jgi:DNA-3-methyladenine glycosylase
MRYLTREFFARDTLTVASDLIGTVMVVGRCAGRIVETEAYTTDAASHHVTRRNQAAFMRETYGRIYIYFIYGMYYCLNFTTDRDGPGAVLIRAVEPLRGIEAMSERRKTSDMRRLATGPGRVCQAFGIDLGLNGLKIGRELKVQPRTDEPVVEVTPRIGISQAVELPWRFYERDNAFVCPHPPTSRNLKPKSASLRGAAKRKTGRIGG